MKRQQQAEREFNAHRNDQRNGRWRDLVVGHENLAREFSFSVGMKVYRYSVAFLAQISCIASSFRGISMHLTVGSLLAIDPPLRYFGMSVYTRSSFC